MSDQRESFTDRLRAVQRGRGSALCVGLDVDPSRLPDGLDPDPSGVERFVRGIVEACKKHEVRVYVCSAAVTAEDPAKAEAGFLQKMCDEGMELSRSLGGGAIDVQRTMRGIQKSILAANAKVAESDMPRLRSRSPTTPRISADALSAIAITRRCMTTSRRGSPSTSPSHGPAHRPCNAQAEPMVVAERGARRQKRASW